jgi:3-methyladenine DNA glycosylase AlkD
MNVKQALQELSRLGTEQNRKTYRRHGVQGELYGVSFANLKALKRKIKVDHALACELWRSGNHDARILATMIVDPSALDVQLLETWAADLDSYTITNAFAAAAGASPRAAEVLEAWIASDREWIARAGWLILARLAGEGEGLTDVYLQSRLEVIEKSIHSAKNRVRDAMNAALIAIAVRNEELREKALAAAARIGKIVVDHGDTACKTPDAAEYIRKILQHRKAGTAVTGA